MGIDFGRTNFIVLSIGLFLIIAGFIFLAVGDITIAPILLVMGYCVAIPLGILLPGRKKEKNRLQAALQPPIERVDKPGS